MTTNIDRAAQVILQSTACTATEVSQTLAAEGLLMPDPQIIRSKTELVTLDPDTVLIDNDGEVIDAGRMQKNLCGFGYTTLYLNPFPAVVITPAEQVRAARKALEKETSND